MFENGAHSKYRRVNTRINKAGGIIMSEKLYWSKISTDDMREIKLTYEDFFKLMDCYYVTVFITD